MQNYFRRCYKCLYIESILFKKFYLFIFNFWLHWIFIDAHGLSLAAVCRFLSSFVAEHELYVCRLSSLWVWAYVVSSYGL